jgi:hypothetical protein
MNLLNCQIRQQHFLGLTTWTGKFAAISHHLDSIGISSNFRYHQHMFQVTPVEKIQWFAKNVPLNGRHNIMYWPNELMLAVEMITPSLCIHGAL